MPRLAFWKRRDLEAPPLATPDAALDEARREDLQYAHLPQQFQAGHTVDVLRDGAETFPAMLEAIEAAQRTVHLETYILRADRTGRRIAAALIARARAGVTVRLLYDSFGALGLEDAYLSELRAAGVKVAEYHPVAPWRKHFHQLTQRDHRKILVVDGEVAFTGGLNIADDYNTVEEGGAGWRDTHCRVRGPAVAELDKIFRRSWLHSGGDEYPPLRAPSAPGAPGAAASAGGALVAIFANEGRKKKQPIRRVYLHAIKRARARLDIANAYFVPDRGLRRAIFNAAARGVRIRIVVPGKSDIPIIRWATRHLYKGFLKAGIEVYEWSGRMMHAKTAVIDERWSTVGSSNLDILSLRVNLEVVAVVIDRAFGKTMAAHHDRDVELAEEIQLETWLRRPWWQKALEWVAYQVRWLL